MCTVTIVPTRDGIRMACNRDELRTRPFAVPPVVRSFGSASAILPIDPVSGGTWIAVNEFGVALTMLNVNPLQAGNNAASRPTSRGTIIPLLLECRSFEACIQQALTLNPRDYAPFRLVITDGTAIAEICGDASALHLRQWTKAAAPLLFTSSGLGDHLVEGRRRQLFDQFFASGDDWSTAQDAYHRHSWPDQRHLSVCMSRNDARTVSYCVVHLGPDDLLLTYHADAPDVVAAETTLNLSVQKGPRR